MKFDVPQISCGHCRGAITDAIRGIDPTAAVDVSIADKTVAVNGRLTADQARRAIEDAGYEAVPIVEVDAPVETAASAGCCGHCHV